MFEVSGSGGEKMDARRPSAKEHEWHRDKLYIRKRCKRRPSSHHLLSATAIYRGVRRLSETRRRRPNGFVYLRDGDGRPRR